MKADFWHDRWSKQEIGFHQEQINSHLQEFWPGLNIEKGVSVFVPLCGKSRDMLWLDQHGYGVTGVEVSPVAVEAFFQENDHPMVVETLKDFRHYRSGGIEIYAGDFFDLTPALVSHIGAVYDRASLIALPPEMRQGYVDHLKQILPARVEMLLISIEYDQSKMPGPPFCVSHSEVEQLYADWCELEIIHEYDSLEDSPRFRERGLDKMVERVYRIRRCK